MSDDKEQFGAGLIAEKAIGTRVGDRFEIKSVLGEGGMGTAYLALDTVLSEECALKVLNPVLSGDERYRARFFQEAKLTRRITHTNVVRTYELGVDRDSGLAYMSMEYVSGASLMHLIESGKARGEFIPFLIYSVCKGLDAIHKEGIIHRDVKPENILIRDDGVVKITDLGIARMNASSLTSHNELLGSSLYIAPEVWKGEEISPAVDFYALGITLYLTCTGRLPFDSELEYNVMMQHINETPQLPSQINREVPESLDKLIMWLLRKDPSERPSSGAEVNNYLKRSLLVEEAPADRDSETMQVVSEKPEPKKSKSLGDASKKRVLAVDDDRGIRELVNLVLATDGYDVVSAASAEEALSIIEDEGRPLSFDFFLLDVQMPGLSGLDLLARFRAQDDTQNIPVIMLTCKSEDEDVMEGYSLGADYYIPKPFTREQLLFGIELILESS